MALKLGSLYVSLSADAGQLVKGMGDALKAVDRFSKEVKRISGELGQTGLALAAVGGAAIKLAATVDGHAARALDSFQNSMRAAAVPLAQILIPALDSLGRMVRQFATYLSELSPQARALVSAFAEWAVVVGASGLALSRVASVVSSLVSFLSALLSGLGALGLAGVAAIAAIAVAIPLLYTAWVDNWGGIQDYARGAFKAIAGWWSETVSDMAFGLSEWANFGVLAFQKVSAAVIAWGKLTGSISEDTARTLSEALERGFSMLQFTKGDIAGGLGKLWENVKAGAGKAKDWFFDTWAKMFADLGLRFGDALKPAAAMAARVAAGPIHSGALGVQRMISTDPNQFGPLAQRDRWTQGQGNKDTALSASIRSGMQIATTSAAELTRAAAASAKATSDALKKAAKFFTDLVVSKLGDVGSIINSGMQGAQNGGVWGALIAVILELVSRTKGFADFMEVANGTLRQITDALSPIFEPLFKAFSKVTAVVTQIVTVLLDSIAPIFEGLGEFLDGFGPILWLVLTLFKALAPLLKTFATVISAIFKALGPVLGILFEIVKGVLLVVMNVLKIITDIIDFFVEAVAGIVDKIVELITLGTEKAGGQFIRDAFGTHAFSASLGDGIKALEEASLDSAQAQANNATAAARAAGAQEDLANKTQQVSESFSNVPSGYKIALARFNAQSTGGPGGGGGSVSGAGGSGGGGALNRSGGVERGGNVFNIDTVNVGAADAAELAAELEEQAKKKRARQTGNPTGDRRNGRWG